MSFLINPYAFLAAGGDYESIATVSVGSGGASSIEFTSIPGTYQHLQVRYVARSTRSGSGFDNAVVVVNSDTGSNYARHQINGDGASATAAGTSSQSDAQIIILSAASATAGIFGAGVIDIMDYAATSKYKTLRTLNGHDNNGSGNVTVRSALWMSTSAITALKLSCKNGNFVEHSTAALYGIKA